MSRVYKQNQVTLGEEQLVRLQMKSVIKLCENNLLNEREHSQVKKTVKEDASTIIADAKNEASKILQDAQLQYDRIINTAKEEAELIISEAYTKSNEILELARQEGYNTGFKEGQEAGFNEVDSIIDEAKEIKQAMLLEKKSIARSLENQIIELVICCIKKIIDFEIEKDHNLLLNLVKKGIEKCIYTDGLIIKVSTNDYELVNASKNKIYMMTEGIDNIDVKKDPALKSGSIIIETTSGTVEASLQTQISQIEQMFHEISKGE